MNTGQDINLDRAFDTQQHQLSHAHQYKYPFWSLPVQNLICEANA